jgi:FkbM family methyltransferase
VTAREVRIGSRRIRVADDQPTFWDRVEAGRWEPGTLAVIDRHVDGRTTFLDLGAWVGPTALYAAGVARRVIAVEADPAALDQLRRNLLANPELARRIEVVPRAIHADEGHVTLGARRKPGDSMSSLLLADAQHTWRSETITPGQLAEMLAAGERLVIKMDLEGAEYRLLLSLKPLLDRADAILVSFHPKILAVAVGTQEAARQTRAALSALSRLHARPVTAAGPAPPSLAPLLMRWRLRSRLPAEDWLFTRRSRDAEPRRAKRGA